MDHKLNPDKSIPGSLEANERRLISKLNRLSQLVEQLQQEEATIQDKLRSNCRELAGEIEKIESKQQRIQQYLKNIPLN